MKKLLNYILLFTVLILAGTSCVKDKGFDNHEYGINDPDTQPMGIGFPQAKNAINPRGINFVSTAQVLPDVAISLFATDPAPVDLHVNIIANNALITAYNTLTATTTTPTNYIPLPAGTFNVASLKITIPKGQRFGSVTINIPDATKLDPLAAYAMGYTVTSIDEGGYTIANNLKDILLSVSIKNKYDGNYKMNINTIGWAAYSISDGVDRLWPSNGDRTSIFMITSSATAVDLFDTYAFGTYIQPAFTPAGAVTGFGATSPRFVFDNANKLINVFNTTPDDGRGRAFALNPLAPAGTNLYDPATKTIFANYIMKQNGRPNQTIIAKFTYVSPRP